MTWGYLHSGKGQHKPEVSPGSGHTRQANTLFYIRNPGLRRIYGSIICGQWHTWSSLPSNYTGYRWIVLRYVGALEFCLFCLLKTKLKSKCRNAISDFKNRNRVIEMKNSMSMMCAGVFTFVTFCVCVFINEGLSMCVGVLVCAWMYNLNYRYRDKF